MMPWREGLVVALGLLVGGCFLSAYQIASWTATGVSYAFSGKGLGDHALSLAMNQDCATWRLVKGEEICVDYGRDFESSWDAMASTWNLPGADSPGDEGAAPNDAEQPVELAPKTPPVTLVAERGENAVFGTPVPALQTPISTFVEATPARGIDLDGLVVPEWAVGPQRETPWQSNAFAPRGLNMDGLVRVDAKPRRPAPAPEKISNHGGDEAAIYLVMGSFRDRSNAERLGDRHSGVTTSIAKIDADGRTMYRLLAGPIEKTALTGVRVDLAKAGIRNSWAVRLCRRSLSAPPCTPALQQALLP